MNSGGALSAAGFGPGTAALVALVALVGALAIHWLRGGAKVSAARQASSDHARTSATVPPLSPRDAALPDWSRPDDPLLSEKALGAVMREYAARAGIPEDVLPKMTRPSGGDGEYLHRDGETYAFSAWERGHVFDEHRDTIADRVLYRVLVARSYMSAYVAGIGADESTRAKRIAAEQERMLGAIDPRWARQFALDRAVAAGG